MSNRKYISTGQIVILFAALALWYAASGAEYTQGGKMLAEGVTAALVTALLSIPICILGGRSHENVPEALSNRFGTMGKLLSAVYFVYFLAVSSEILRLTGIFAAKEMFTHTEAVICIILLGLACCYIAHTGTAAICRMTAVILFLMIVGAAILGISSMGNIHSIDTTAITLQSVTLRLLTPESILPQMTAAAALMSILISGAGRSTGKGILIGIAVSLCVTAIMTAAVYLILGTYVSEKAYPAVELVKYISGTKAFKPYGIYNSLWIIIAAAASGIFSAGGGECLRAVFPTFRQSELLTALIAAAAAAISEYGDLHITEQIYKSLPLSSSLVLIPPLLLLFTERRVKKHGA